MTSFSQDKKPIAFLFLFSFLLFLVISSALQLYRNSEAPDYKFQDCYSYEKVAKKIYCENKFSATRGFGYPVLIGLPYLLSIPQHYHIFWIWALQLGSWFFTQFLVYRTVHLLTGKVLPSLFAGIIFSLSLSNLSFTTVILSEAIYSTFLAWAVYYFVRSLIKKQPGDAAISFFLLCVSTVMRATHMHLIPVCFAILAFFLIKLRALRISTVFFPLLGIAAILFQMAMVKKDHGAFKFSVLGNKAIYEVFMARVESVKSGKNLWAHREKRSETFMEVWHQSGLNGLDSLMISDLKYNLKHNFKYVMSAYFMHIWINSRSSSVVISSLRNRTGSKLFDFLDFKLATVTRVQDLIYSFSLLILFPVVFFAYHKKIPQNLTFTIFFVWYLCFYSVLITAFSTLDGDRFHMVLYPEIISISFYFVYLVFGEQPAWKRFESSTGHFFGTVS